MIVEKLAKFFDTNILKVGTKIFYTNKDDNFEGEATIIDAYDVILYVRYEESPFEYDDYIQIEDYLDGTVNIRIIE